MCSIRSGQKTTIKSDSQAAIKAQISEVMSRNIVPKRENDPECPSQTLVGPRQTGFGGTGKNITSWALEI